MDAAGPLPDHDAGHRPTVCSLPGQCMCREDSTRLPSQMDPLGQAAASHPPKHIQLESTHNSDRPMVPPNTQPSSEDGRPTEILAPLAGFLSALTLGVHRGHTLGLQGGLGRRQQGKLGPWIPMSSSSQCCPRKSTQAGAASPWVLIISLTSPVHAPTHGLLREKRKKKMRTGSWVQKLIPRQGHRSEAQE